MKKKKKIALWEEKKKKDLRATTPPQQGRSLRCVRTRRRRRRPGERRRGAGLRECARACGRGRAPCVPARARSAGRAGCCVRRGAAGRGTPRCLLTDRFFFLFFFCFYTPRPLACSSSWGEAAPWGSPPPFPTLQNLTDGIAGAAERCPPVLRQRSSTAGSSARGHGAARSSSLLLGEAPAASGQVSSSAGRGFVEGRGVAERRSLAAGVASVTAAARRPSR